MGSCLSLAATGEFPLAVDSKRSSLIDPWRATIEEWVSYSHGADPGLRKDDRRRWWPSACARSERTTRPAVARTKEAWRPGRVGSHRR